MALIFWGRILMPSTTAHCVKEALVLMALNPKSIFTENIAQKVDRMKYN
jgi:hypothetical protein